MGVDPLQSLLSAPLRSLPWFFSDSDAAPTVAGLYVTGVAKGVTLSTTHLALVPHC